MRSWKDMLVGSESSKAGAYQKRSWSKETVMHAFIHSFKCVYLKYGKPKMIKVLF